MSHLQPPRNTQSRFLGQQNLVLQLAAFKKHAAAIGRCYELGNVVLMDTQFAAIVGQPAGV